MKSKTAADTTRAFERAFQEKVWSDRGTEFIGEFKQFCYSKKVELYNTHSETKSVFAERIIRSLKNIIYKHKHPEKNWCYHYIKNLHDFVGIITSRDNRVKGLAPEKVTSKHESLFISLVSIQAKKHLERPKFKRGDFVRVSKANLPFKKGFTFQTKSYQQNLWNCQNCYSESSNLQPERVQQRKTSRYFSSIRIDFGWKKWKSLKFTCCPRHQWIFLKWNYLKIYHWKLTCALPSRKYSLVKDKQRIHWFFFKTSTISAPEKFLPWKKRRG